MGGTARALAPAATVLLLGALVGIAPAARADQLDIGSSLVADAGCSPNTLAQGETVTGVAPASRFYLTGKVNGLDPGETYSYVWTGPHGDVVGSVPLGRANGDGVINVGELAIALSRPVTTMDSEPFSIVDDSTGKGVASGRIAVVVRDATLCRVLGVLTAGPSGPDRYTVGQQADGNVVERNGSGRALWSTGTAGHTGATTTMQSDGNCVVRDSHGHAIWETGTAGNANATLTLQTDDNVVVRSASGRALWASGIHH